MIPDDNPTPIAPKRRTVDETLPTILRFILSLVIILGCFGYLFLAKPNEVITAAVLAFVGTVISFWFVFKRDGEGA